MGREFLIKVVLLGASTLCAAAAKVSSGNYRWRSFGNAGQVTSVALPSKGASAVIVLNQRGYVLRDPGHPDLVPMERVTSVAVGEYDSEVIVAVGEASTGGNLRFSLDGGQTWRPCPSPPKVSEGVLAVSSLGKIWVWQGPKGAFRTMDYGFRWEACEGLEPEMKVVADRTSSRRFYAFDHTRLLLSDDGAKTFLERDVALPRGADLDREIRDVLPSPGRAGDLWLLTGQALYRSVPGKPYTRIAGVTDPALMTFGRAQARSAPGPTQFSIFLIGTVLGSRGLFRSDDEGQTWIPLQGIPAVTDITGIYGDRQRAQTVYLAQDAKGLVEGRPR